MRPLLFALFFSLPLLSPAQAIWKKAYVVKNNGDSVRGFIDYKDWDNNPKRIKFKENLTSPSAEYTVNDIVAFEVENLETFKRWNIKFTLASPKLNHLKRYLDTTRATQTVFLKVLKEGKNVSLYSFEDNIKNRFYISDRINVSPTELENHLYVDNNIVITTHSYRSHLLARLTNLGILDEQVIGLVQTLDLIEPQLFIFIDKINSEEPKVLRRPKSHRFYSGLHLITNATHYGGDHFLASPAAVQNNTYSPMLALGIMLYKNREVKNLYVKLGVSIAQTSSEVKRIEPSNYNKQETSKINQIITSISSLVGYNLVNTAKFKWFLAAGPCIELIKFRGNTFSSYKSFLPGQLSEQPMDVPRFSKSFVSAFQGVSGFELKQRWELSMSYKRTGKINSDETTSIHNATKSIGISYLF